MDDFLPTGRRVVFIADRRVFGLYEHLLSGRECIVVPAGEEHKNIETVTGIWRRLIEIQADRDVFIVGFGGGTVTDMVGFAAATYLRGVDFGFVATTLLAQVDASIGGKNGVNVLRFKNMAGTFAQPLFVLCDPAVLRTLPAREFRAGLAEMVKAAIVGDAALFEMLENNTPDKLLNDSELLMQAIMRAIRVKTSIVEADEREKGERRKLNLGHTLGHAIEHLTGQLLHGEAVSVGITAAAGAAVSLGLLDQATRTRIEKCLENCGLPTAPDPALELSKKALVDAMTRDKKASGSGLYLVLPRSIGDVAVRQTPFGELENLLG